MNVIESIQTTNKTVSFGKGLFQSIGIVTGALWGLERAVENLSESILPTYQLLYTAPPVLSGLTQGMIVGGIIAYGAPMLIRSVNGFMLNYNQETDYSVRSRDVEHPLIKRVGFVAGTAAALTMCWSLAVNPLNDVPLPEIKLTTETQAQAPALNQG